MMDYWRNLTDREKWLVSTAGILGLMVAVYLGVFRPLAAYYATSERELLAAQQMHNRIARGAAILAAQPENDNSSNSREERPLRVAVSTAARASGVAISRIQPGGDGSLTVWVESVATNELYGWMNRMVTEHHIAPSKLLVQKTAAAGRLRAQLQFEGQ